MARGRTRHIRSVACALVLTFTLSSCWAFSSDTNTVYGGNGIYFLYKKRATDNIVDTLHYGLNRGDERDTLSFMLDMVKSKYIKGKLAEFAFALSDFDYFFNSVNDPDFETAASDTHNNSRCLMMHRNPASLEDRHNWTYRVDADRYCIPGKGYV